MITISLSYDVDVVMVIAVGGKSILMIVKMVIITDENVMKVITLIKVVMIVMIGIAIVMIT